MRTAALVIASLTLFACGGSVGTPEPADAGGEAAAQSDAASEADAPSDPCVCMPDALYCHGVRRPDAESCSKCGYPCDSTKDAGGE